eukprot:CAMPEP_0178377058 /NCGR_PEP_ID=MMETSP0689_2-20121128/3723_1 /TAXON_ID=160604 /ORGANISM="Amphidinium massartii, Strain CS-259" /LENGTH=592 /DNA_ID=CAMNT_0019997101 /DNA_START=105 /DNA_END=1883 /DNA_ORIENTATION=+
MSSTLMLPLLLLLPSWVSASPGYFRIEMEADIEVQLPQGWQVLGRAPAESMLELTVAVRQQNLKDLHDTLMRVSTPSSPEYGQHLSQAEVNTMTAPSHEHLSSVLAYLAAHRVVPQTSTPNKDILHAHVSVAQAELMLQTKYFILQHQTGTKITRALGGYSLPQAVALAVDFVAPTVHIPGVIRRHQHSTQQLTVNTAAGNLRGNQNRSRVRMNDPKHLRTLYSIGAAQGLAPNNKQAVTAFLEQYYSAASLQTFWQEECTPEGLQCGKGSVRLVGDATTGKPGTESMLDIEYITGVAGNVESEFWGFAGRSPDNRENEPFMKWLSTLSSTSDMDVPKIFSTSYGEDEGSWSLPAATRLNVEFQKAGVRGITLLYAAGDEGANCKGGVFVPEGPGSSPYVTAVGGTGPGKTWPNPGKDAEVAVGLSSGGFSNYWDMPDYQKEAVAAYLTKPDLPKQSERGFNTSGRAYPDIAAQAVDFFVYAGGPEPGVAGTSCASPTAAGVFALVNDLRLQQGKATLGFLNPLIYSHPEAFNDVTSGASSGCGFRDGWPAKDGWDAVTGHGTPNYAKLAALASKLPSGKLPFAEEFSILVM